MAFCSFCFERHAIAFTTRTVNGENIDEAYCVKCAYQSKIAGVKEQLTAAGINDGNIDEIADKFEMKMLENNTDGDVTSFFRNLVNEKIDLKPFAGSDAPVNNDTNMNLENSKPDLEAVKRFFEGDKYATEVTGIVIEKAEKGHSVVSLMPNSRHLNAVGGLMGAVYYTMADFAFAVAENCILDSDTITVTQATQMNFLRSWHGGKITCTADIVKDGRYICLYEVKAFDKDGTELALIIVNGFKTARK